VGVRLYWELAVRGFQRTAVYRTAAISGAITNTFFGFLRAYVFIAFYEARPEAGGYTLSDALAFTFLTQGMASLVEMWAWWRIAETVQTGQIATDLSRPFDYQLYWLAQDYGRALHQFLLRSLPPLLIGMVAFDVRLPSEAITWLAFLPSVLLAITVSFGWRFCLNLTTFWWMDYRGAAALASLIGLLLSGFLVPLAMFPDSARAAIYLMPLASMVAIPIDIFLGKLSGLDLVGALALQAFWALAMLWIGRIVLGAALRKLVVQGG
jgi:ABC-2 type transport system permease protein